MTASTRVPSWMRSEEEAEPMLYELLYPLRDSWGPLNVFGYISFRAAAAMTTALLLTMFLYPPFIRWLQRKKFGQEIRSDGPQSHLVKQGTPTMGGLLILSAVIVSSLLWANLRNPQVWMALTIGVGYLIVGFLDDWNKITRKSSKGMSGKQRLLIEAAIAGVVLWFGMYYLGIHDTVVPVPFFKDADFLPDLGIFYLPFGVFVIVATANSVNLTDGLDGLAIGPVMTAALTFGLLAYLVGSPAYAAQLNLHHVPGSAELTVVTVTLAGAGMGFLWYNSYPATIFMGDTGSLPLGGILGTLAVLTHNELLLVIIGGVFVVEALSVIIQVVSFKTTGRRVFRMAPIHHHFEEKGWEEPKVIVRFWIISIMLALFAVMTLKLR
jgi:phospho-N-acetylmuramoyl-pentapeptide-transferase